MSVTPGETLHVPVSNYDLGQGYEVIVLYADERRVALRYPREDSAGAAGYTVHVDGLCTDPNLLALYTQLDARGWPALRVPAAGSAALRLSAAHPPGRQTDRRSAQLGSGRGDRGHRQLHGSPLVQRVVANPAGLHGDMPAA